MPSLDAVLDLFLSKLYVLLFGVGAYILLAALWSFLQARASEDWPQASGKITDSKVSMYIGGKGRPRYRAFVRYTYSVMSEEYTGKRVAFGVGTGARSAAEEIVARYPVGATVPVYHHPEKPARSVLERRSMTGWMQYLAAVVVIVLGIFLVVNSGW